MVLLARRYHFGGASSSAVEQETLNLLVVGSNPSWLTRSGLAPNGRGGLDPMRAERAG